MDWTPGGWLLVASRWSLVLGWWNWLVDDGCYSGRRPASAMSVIDVEQRLVEPYVLVARRQQESPARRQIKVGQEIRAE